MSITIPYTDIQRKILTEAMVYKNSEAFKTLIELQTNAEFLYSQLPKSHNVASVIPSVFIILFSDLSGETLPINVYPIAKEAFTACMRHHETTRFAHNVSISTSQLLQFKNDLEWAFRLYRDRVNQTTWPAQHAHMSHTNFEVNFEQLGITEKEQMYFGQLVKILKELCLALA